MNRPNIHHGALWLPETAIRLASIRRVSWAPATGPIPPQRYIVEIHEGVASSVAGPTFDTLGDLNEWVVSLMSVVWGQQ